MTNKEEYECSSLMHELPRRLFGRDKNWMTKQTGLAKLNEVTYQKDNGVLEWVGRYALIHSDL